VKRSFEILLEAAGMEFKSFGSAELFLSGATPTVNDLLLLDISLPGMSGLDLLCKLQKENKNAPAIVISALDDAHSREGCKKYGVKAFLRKPIDSEALIDLIKYHSHS